MKKTLIASAISAVIAAPAFADVSVTGNVIAEYAEDTMVTRNDIVFSASEDLGNGLKSAVKMHTMYDDGTAGSADFTVSLSGDFGSISAGRQEGFQEGVFDAFVNIDASHDGDLEGTLSNGAGLTRNERVIYMSPSMNGLQIGLSAADNGVDKAADTEVMAKYSANGLTVMAGVGSAKDGNEFTNFAASYSMGGLTLLASHRNVQTKATAASTTDVVTYSVAQEAGITATAAVLSAAATANTGTYVTKVADVTSNTTTASYSYAAPSGTTVAYAAGDLLETTTYGTAAVAAVDSDTTFVGAKYVMGNNDFAVGMVDDDTNGDASIVSARHNFSKTTNAYIVNVDTDTTNTTYIGLMKKF